MPKLPRISGAETIRALKKLVSGRSGKKAAMLYFEKITEAALYHFIKN